MPFTKGRFKTGGRQLGTPNKYTGTFREAVRVVYEGLGGHTAFLTWAQQHPDEFYRIAARLIPAEGEEGNKEGPATIVVRHFTLRGMEERRCLPTTEG